MEKGAQSRAVGAWFLFGGLVLAYFISFLFRVSASVVMPSIALEWGLSATVTSVISSLYFYSYSAMQPLSGALNEKFGPSKVVAAGLAVAAVGSMMFGYSSSPFFLGAGRLLAGLGLAPMLSGALVFIGTNFDRKNYAANSGMTFFVGNLGAIAAVSPLGMALDRWGRTDVFLALSLISLILAALLIVGRRYDRAERVRGSSKGAAGMGSIAGRVRESWRIIRKSKALIACAFLWAAALGPLLSLQGLWAVAWAKVVYEDMASARLWATLLGVGMMAGNLAGALLSPYVKSRIKIISASVVAFGLLWVAICASMALKWPFAISCAIAFSLGLFTGNSLTLLSAAINDFSPAGWGGSVFGIINMGVFVTSIFAQMFAGFVIDRLSGGAVYAPISFVVAYGIIAVFPISAMALLSRLRQGRPADSV